MPPREQLHIGFDAKHTTLEPRDLFGCFTLRTDTHYRLVRRSRKCPQRQDRDFVKRRHRQEVAIPCHQALRLPHQGRFEQLVIIRIATPELSPGNRNPLRDGLELGQPDGSDFPADVRIELPAMKPDSKLGECLVREQQHSMCGPYRFDNCARRTLGAQRRADQDVGIGNDTVSSHPLEAS